MKIVEQPGDLAGVAALVLPGVGATGAAMQRLHARDLVGAIKDWHLPLLGICVGLQLFFDESEEDNGPCLGMVAGTVRRLRRTPRLPHIGWNDVAWKGDRDPVFAGIDAGTPFYFVHSFAPDPLDDTVTAATVDYGEPFVAAVRSGNLVGVQFHPERSGEAGLRLLANFVAETTRAA